MLLANAWQKVSHIIPGGKERWESSVNAIRQLRGERLEARGEENNCQLPIANSHNAVNLLLHDAARPFVSQEIIARVCEALEEHEAVTVAIPSTDTVYEMVEGKVARIPNRATIMRAQTPQAFRLELIAEAYAKALGVDICDIQACSACHLPATDDCGVLFNHMPMTPIHIVLGEEQNKKITFKEDI
jgi:2-C-methyl-D-erythritol 4-phosphate cytidylyltransferase